MFAVMYDALHLLLNDDSLYIVFCCLAGPLIMLVI